MKLLNRRSFLLDSAACAGLAILGVNGAFSNSAIAAPKTVVKQGTKSLDCPRLFCTAYITPDAPGQGGQEEVVAKYPLIIVPQDDRLAFVKWRDKVRVINPGIIMLGYQMTIEETTVPGPGHRQLAKARDAWCKYPGGILPTIPRNNGARRGRIYDPRTKEWRENFLAACDETLKSYPFDGLFLDQCSVYQKASLSPFVFEEMKEALQSTLSALRRAHPGALIVGNSRYSWKGLNGELSENRIQDAQKELDEFPGHEMPRIEMIQVLLKSRSDYGTFKRGLEIAQTTNAFFGAAVDYQHAIWFDEFDEIVKKTQSSNKNARLSRS